MGFLDSAFGHISDTCEKLEDKVGDSLFSDKKKIPVSDGVCTKAERGIIFSNHFENVFSPMIISEFLKVVAEMIHYEETSPQFYTATLVRRPNLDFTEYLSFTKNMDNGSVRIDYTVVSLSHTGSLISRCFLLGDTFMKYLDITQDIANSIMESLDLTLAPYYVLRYSKDNHVDIGASKFLYGCWITTNKIIIKRVNTQMKQGYDDNAISVLANSIGFHLFMSFLRFRDEPFFYLSKKSSIGDLASKCVDFYNAQPSNINKVIQMDYERNNLDTLSMHVLEGKDIFEINNNGVKIFFYGRPTAGVLDLVGTIGYKLVESLYKSENKDIRWEFLYFLYSTGFCCDNYSFTYSDILKHKTRKIEDSNLVYVSIVINPILDKLFERDGLSLRNRNWVNPNETRDLVMAVNNSLVHHFGDKSGTRFSEADINLTRFELSDNSSNSEELKDEEKHAVSMDDSYKQFETVSEIPSLNINQQAKGSFCVHGDLEPIKKLAKMAEREDEFDNPACHESVDSIESVISKKLLSWTKEDCEVFLKSPKNHDYNVSISDVLLRYQFLILSASSKEGKKGEG